MSSRLRHPKIRPEHLDRPALIRTVRGAGYKAVQP